MEMYNEGESLISLIPRERVRGCKACVQAMNRSGLPSTQENAFR